jgi:PKHD-type hydroxylase
MIRVSEFQGLTKENLLKINQIYDQSEMITGKMSVRFPGYHIKNNTEMDHTDQYLKMCCSIVNQAIFKDDNFFEYASALKINSLSGLLFSEYLSGMFYHSHNDSFFMSSNTRSDWSCTIFLNDPSEYEGGELMIDIGDREIPYKLNAGQYVLYPTGLTHRVNTVTSGKRRVCVFWVQSYIADTRIRSILTDIFAIQEKYQRKWNEEDKWLSDKFTKICFSLKREFMQR